MIRIRFVLIITTLIIACSCQPKCSATGIPKQLPMLTNQHLLLDMTRYIHGPNITLTLQSSNPEVTLKPKLAYSQQTHNLGNVLQVNYANKTVTMLGVSSTNRFYIYYASVSHPHSLSAKEIPISLQRCSNHAVSPDGQSVAVTCQSADRQYFILAYGGLEQSIPWTIQRSKKYASSITRQIQYISQTRIAVIIKHPYNSYIQLWDIKYSRLMSIYDRVSFGLQYLNIVDVQMTAGSLYIMNYQTGIYQLRMVDVTHLSVVGFSQFPYYSKMAVYIDSIVVSKKGSITQYGGKSVFKYQAVGNQTIKQLIISDQYIISYTDNQIIAYLRGYHTPYLTIPFPINIVAGVFTSPSHIIQAVSQTDKFQVSLQQITLSHPYLQVLKYVPDGTQVTVNAVSVMEGNQQHCQIKFQVLRTEEMAMEIFDNQYSRSGTQHIYMNRPGRAQIDLTPYGMGPNLNYKIQRFAESVNLTYQIKKIHNIQHVQIQGLDKISVKQIYFSDTCGQYKTECPLVIDSATLNMMKFYLCSVDADYYGTVHKISCVQKYKQFKISEYVHYQLQQSSSQLQYFYQISVFASAPNQIILRKFQITNLLFKPVIITRFNLDNNDTKGQSNITQLQYDQQNSILYALLPNKKVIQVWKVSEQGDQFVLKNIVTVDRSIVNGGYFAPHRFQLDSDGGLWVKCYDQILVVDFRKIQKVRKPTVLSVINIDLQVVKTYDYQFQVVEQRKSASIFTPFTNPTPKFPQAVPLAQQRNRKYLLIYDKGNTLLMCTVNHLYEVDQKQLQPLPRYGYDMPQNRSMMVVQSLGNSQVFVSLMGFGQIMVNMIYNLDCLSLVEVYYASVQTRNTAIPTYFHLTSNYNPIIMFVQPVTVNSTIGHALQVAPHPTLLLTVTNKVDQLDSQILLIQVQNQKVHIRHSVILGISNSPQNLTKGPNYPYPSAKTYAIDHYIQVDTHGWVEGNVLNISYVCDNCQKPTDQNKAWVDIKGKLWHWGKYDIAGGQFFQVINARGENALIVLAYNNMIYIFDPTISTITGLHQLTQTSSDTILSTKYNSRSRILLSAIKSSQNDVYLVTFSTANYKGFQLDKYLMPATMGYVMNMDYKGNVAVILDLQSVYLVAIDHYGLVYVVDYVNQVQAGGAVCWAQLMQPSGKVDHYTLMLTLCQSGVTYITFKLQQSSILTITNKQTFDLKSHLQTLNIRMPTDSSFRRSSTSISQDGTQLSIFLMILNFNSFQWVFKLRNGVVVYQIMIEKVIHRYGDFGATESVSFGHQDRFMMITYYGIKDDVYQYVHAVYDLTDGHKGNQPYTNCYIMQSFTTKTNTRPQFSSNNTFFLLSDDAHHLTQFDVANKFRAIVHNQLQLPSQSVFMIPHSPFSSIKIQIYIKGVDVKVWEFWEIMVIVLLGIIGFCVLICVGKICLQRYQRNRKLVPLLVDYAEYEEDMLEEIQEKKRRTQQIQYQNQNKDKEEGIKQQQINNINRESKDEKIGDINASDRGSLNI